jgi:peptidoglycan/LPS O-acetylase OafA/YrhL
MPFGLILYMKILIIDAPFNTLIFGIIFCAALLLSIRKPENKAFFAPFRTQELKGLAILAIVFSHIGYFLSSDTEFLWPFSVAAGVGVNMFLFLSGFGLTISSLKKPVSIFEFYFKRLKKLFIPLWIIIGIFFLSDYFILQKSYQTTEIWKSFIGLFPVADLFNNLNSPLWYFTLILFYYLIFPLTFFKKIAYLCPILILLVSFYLLKTNLPFEINEDVIKLYKTHFAAFPLGILFALLINDQKLSHIKLKFKEIFLFSNLKYILIAVFTVLFAYLSIHSGVGDTKTIEQTTSLITMFSIIFVFIAKPLEFKLLTIFGIYSYEIYLIHWPILSRYDFLYKYIPAYLATLLYLGLFLGLGYLMQKLLHKLKV